MVNADVNGENKTLNHRKIIRKTHRNNLLQTKRMLKTNCKFSGSSVFTFSLPGGKFAPLLPSGDSRT